MAAVQYGKKKVQPQKQRNECICGKSAYKTIHQSKQKQVPVKRTKGKEKKLAGRQLKKGKKTQSTSKVSVPKMQQKKTSLPTKSGGKNADSRTSTLPARAKVGRNLCFFSSKDLQYEVNELIRKELTARMFASNGRVSN